MVGKGLIVTDAVTGCEIDFFMECELGAVLEIYAYKFVNDVSS